MVMHRFPFTERGRTEPALGKPALDGAREAEIERLVALFYERGREDPLIGPVFETHVRDWGAHLATMRDFWTSAIYRTGRYSGRPIEAHRVISELTPGHFDRWIELWEGAVRDAVRSDARDDLIVLARRMAGTMAERLGVSGAG